MSRSPDRPPDPGVLIGALLTLVMFGLGALPGAWANHTGRGERLTATVTHAENHGGREGFVATVTIVKPHRTWEDVELEGAQEGKVREGDRVAVNWIEDRESAYLAGTDDFAFLAALVSGAALLAVAQAFRLIRFYRRAGSRTAGA